jgi:hypothetical protein
LGHEKEKPTYVPLKTKKTTNNEDKPKTADSDLDDDGVGDGITKEKTVKTNLESVRHFKKVKNDENKENTYNIILHSFNTNELGFTIIDKHGNIARNPNDPEVSLVSIPKGSNNYNNRYDNLYGLLRNEKINAYFSHLKGYSESDDGTITLSGEAKTKALSLLFNLRVAALYGTDNKDSLTRIRKILSSNTSYNLNENDINIGFAY